MFFVYFIMNVLWLAIYKFFILKIIEIGPVACNSKKLVILESKIMKI